jgi:hypothetical protein
MSGCCSPAGVLFSCAAQLLDRIGSDRMGEEEEAKDGACVGGDVSTATN